MIMISSVFRLTEDLTPVQKEMSENYSVLFLNDESGTDWYVYQKRFQDDTWKVAVDEQGKVISLSQDCSSLFPQNLIVVEIEKLPSGFNMKEPWFINLDTLEVYRDEKYMAEEKLRKLTDDATLIMQPLIQAEEDGDLTEDESEKLRAYRQYRTELRRLDVSNAPNIHWPSIPTFVD